MPGPAPSTLVLVRDLEVGGAPRLYLDLLARLRDGGRRVGIAAAGGALEPQVAAAGIAMHPIDWSGRPSEVYAAVAAAATAYDAALLTCDPLLMGAAPAALLGCGRLALAILSPAPHLAAWFGPAGMTDLGRTARALARAPEGAVIVRGPVQRRLVAEQLGLAADALAVVEPGVAVDAIAFEPAVQGDGTVLVLTRLGPDTLDRVRAGVELVASGRRAGRNCRLLLVGDGSARDEALGLCATALPEDAWQHEGLTTDPLECYRRAEVVVAMGRSAFEAAALGRRVATSRRAGDGRGVLGPPLTSAHYDEFADDLLGCGYEPRGADAVWRALDAVDAAELAAVRRRVEERNSGARQAVDVAALLASLQPSAAAELIGAVGAMAATTADELRDARRTSDDLWAARSWYEAQLQLLRER